MSHQSDLPHVPSAISTGEGVQVPTAPEQATPRTDEELAGYAHKVARFMPQLGEETHTLYIPANFARTLERELAAKDREIAAAKAMLCDIKDRVSADDDFSADEIIEFIGKHIGELSQGPTWAMIAAHKEIDADNAALRAEVERLGKIIDAIACAGGDEGASARMAMETLELRAEVAELEQDKARLDWLEVESQVIKQFAVGPTINGEKWILLERGVGPQNYFGDTLRAAIDAARDGKAGT